MLVDSSRCMRLLKSRPTADVDGARLVQILDLLAEDSRLNVYAGELEVRPPGAPTTWPGHRWADRLAKAFPTVRLRTPCGFSGYSSQRCRPRTLARES